MNQDRDRNQYTPTAIEMVHEVLRPLALCVAIAMSLRRIMFRPKFNALLYKTFNLYITLILVSNSLNVSF